MEKGEKTPQYKAIKSNYTGLISSLEPVLLEVTGNCFENDLISTAERDRANDQRPEAVRSRGLVDTILKKIKSNIKWYEIFMKILKESTALDEIVQDITTSFTTTSGSSSGSGDITTSFTTASGSSSRSAAGQHPPPAPKGGDDKPDILDSDDMSDILDGLTAVQARYYEIGTMLHLGSAALHMIKNRSTTDAMAMSSVVEEWLNKEYNTGRFGPPTWKMLVDAVGNPNGGRNSRVAEEIAQKRL